MVLDSGTRVSVGRTQGSLHHRMTELYWSTPVSTILFHVALGFWVFVNVLYTSFYALPIVSFIKPLRIVCLAMLLLKELLGSRVTHRAFMGIILIGIVMYIEWRIGQSLMIDTLAFVICSRDQDVRKAIRTGAVCIALAFTLIVVSAYMGLIRNAMIVSSGRVRYCLGFRYALYPSAYLFTLTCSFLYLGGSETRLWHYILLLVINGICYRLTNSRLSFAMSILVIMLCLASRRFNGRVFAGRVFGALLTLAFPAMTLISLFVVSHYAAGDQWAIDLSIKLPGRIEFAWQAINNYGISLLGTNLKADMVGAGLNIYGVVNTGNYFYVDNLYIRMLVEGGVLVLAAYVIAMSMVCRNVWLNGDVVLGIVLLCMALHGLMDNLLMNLYYNPFLLLINTLLTSGTMMRHAHNAAENDYKQLESRRLKASHAKWVY